MQYTFSQGSHLMIQKLQFLRFKDKYETPILRGNDKNASDREKRTGSSIAKVIIFFSKSNLYYLNYGFGWH